MSATEQRLCLTRRQTPVSGLDLSVYLVTDTALCGPRGVPTVVEAAVRGGVTCVQVRDKTASTRALLSLVAEVVNAAAGVPVLVNDRLDVALAARAAGIAVAGLHVGQSDLPVAVARALLWPGAALGLSVSRPDELAHTAGADHLGVGPVRDTATKPGHGPTTGVDGAGRLAARAGLPCVAIGGLDASLAGPLRAARLAGAAYVSAICAAPDPEAAARQLAVAWGT